MAKPLNDENRQKSKFAYLPYLNSSIFQKQSIEKELGINALDNGTKMQIYAHTSLYDEKHKKRTGEIKFLEYLFEFLDAFDFGENSIESENMSSRDLRSKSKQSSNDEAILKSNNATNSLDCLGGEMPSRNNEIKTQKSDLISSAVLGQIFERLNGYKDGSYYTPSFITSYMCKESIDKIVLAKFSEYFGSNLENLDKLENQIDRFILKSDDTKKDYEALNDIIDTIKICDPAVGSGYFLVSALNYIIALKSRLGILVDETGKLLKAKIKYENDELDIVYNDSTRFYYTRPTSQTDPRQIIQKTLFNEKAKLIENCLFGVDINPNSCEIARLRLWIELLKSSYFTDFDPNPLKSNSLETLPNIDINIKCGNSLVSYFELHKKFTINNIKNQINNYKFQVNLYKNGLGDKTQISKEIKRLQEMFKNLCFKNEYDKQIKKFNEARESYYKKYGVFLIEDEPKLQKGFFSNSFDFYEFDENDAKKDFEKLLKLYDETFSLDTLNPFEWRFEFPEILDENGDFEGFDLIIANPPYIRQEALKEQKTALKAKFKIFCGTADIYTYFFELGLNILKNGGILSFITSNKFFRASYGQNLREFMLKNAQIHSITDLNGLKVFDMAIVDTAITILQKQKPQKSDTFAFSNPKTKDFKNVEFCKISQSNLSSESFIFLNPLEANLKAKIERIGTPLKDWDININYGIKTGLNEAFIIDKATRAEILSGCQSSAELERTKAIIKRILRGRDIKRYSYSWAGIYLINFHNGYTSSLQNAQPCHCEKNEVFRSNLANGEAVLKSNNAENFQFCHSERSEESKNSNSDSSFASQTQNDENSDILAVSRNDKEIPPLDINDFPSLKKHFDKFEPALTKRSDKGVTPYNLRNCAYLEEFEKEKIIYSEIVRSPQFHLDNEKFYAEATSFLLTGENLHYLVGMLNSQITAILFKKFYAGGGLGESGFRYKKAFLENLPIPKISKEKEAEFVNLVDKILEIKNRRHSEPTGEESQIQTQDSSLSTKAHNDTRDDEIALKILEKELENKIFALYELNQAEIATVKSLSLSLSLAIAILAIISANSKCQSLLNTLLKGFENELKEVFSQIPIKIQNKKISWQRVASKPCFIAENEFYLLDSMAFFTINSPFISVDYLLAFLNSKIIFWYLKQIGHLYSDTGFLISNQYVERLPIPQITPKNQNLADEIINFVNQILNETDEKQRTNLSSEIDKLVYKLYDLTAEEIALIENA